MKKKGFLQLKTEAGQIGWAAGVFFLLFLGILLSAFLQLEIYRSSAGYLEDALAASNLASAVIDVEEYGISHRVQIADVKEAYERYQTAVKGNLNLNEAWEGINQSILSGPVNVVNYTVYNVSGNDVAVSYFDESGLLTEWQEQLGTAAAPNGKKIEHTGVYSEITYQVKGILGMTVQAHKGKLADIVADGYEEE